LRCAHDRQGGQPAIGEHTGLEARTIHRLLEADPRTGGFRRNAANPLIRKLLVIAESSMADVLLMRSLLRALPDAPALLMVGAWISFPPLVPVRCWPT
jgi:exodeoxyribonuclease V alpha subunit